MGKDVIARSPTKAEIKEKNPYNTYIVKGLPIAPISNPSVASLFAAAGHQKRNFFSSYLMETEVIDSQRHMMATKKVLKFYLLGRKNKGNQQELEQ